MTPGRSPDATPHQESVQLYSEELDLAAMPLRPSDVGEPGYRLLDGTRTTLAAEAAGVAERLEIAPEDARELLTEAGYLRGQDLRLGLPRPDVGGDFTVSRGMRTYVNLYESAHGATDGFVLIEDESQLDASRDIPGTRTIGDMSEITRTTDVDAEGVPFDSLDLTFQLGNLTGGETLRGFESDGRIRRPEVAHVERLAELLIERIEAVAADGSPNLDRLIVRPNDVAENRELYLRLEGEEMLLAAPLAYALVPSNAAAPEPPDVYHLQTRLGSGSDLAVLDVRVSGFATEADAAAWLDALEAGPAEDERHVDLARESDVSGIGEQSLAFSYRYPVTEDFVLDGHAIYLRVDRFVAGIDLVGIGVSLLEAETFATEQASCLANGGCDP